MGAFVMPPPPGAFCRPDLSVATNLPSCCKTPDGCRTPKTPEGNRTPGSRRSRRANKLKTWCPTPDVPSRGSKNHFQGKCRPCFAFTTPEGCPSGAMCNFCHFEHDDDNIDKAVQFSEEKKTRSRRVSRVSFLEEPIDFDQESSGCDCNGAEYSPQCEFQCLPMQNGQHSTDCRNDNSKMFARRKSAPAIMVMSFNPTLPFLPFPDADKMEASPDFCKQVLSTNDSQFIAEILMQNMPERYED